MKSHNRQHTVWLICIAGAVALSGLLVLAGLSAGSAGAGPESLPAPLRADTVLNRPRHLLHRTVVVEGQVARTWGSRAFTLRSRFVRQELLVVLGHGVGPQKGQAVEVVGSVRLLSRQEVQALRREFGLDPSRGNLWAVHANAPYILAAEVRRGSGGDE